VEKEDNMGTAITYGQGLYDSEQIKKHAKEYLAVLPPTVEMLVSRGSSGCAIASAMLTLADRKLEHHQFRKQGEPAHSEDCAGKRASWRYQMANPLKGIHAAIVDDIVSTGETLESLLLKCSIHHISVEVIIVSKVWWAEYEEWPRLEEIRKEGKMFILNEMKEDEKDVQ